MEFASPYEYKEPKKHVGWGGYRPGAGRKKKEFALEGLTIQLRLNKIQAQVLKELGRGSIEAGVQSLVNQHV